MNEQLYHLFSALSARAVVAESPVGAAVLNACSTCRRVSAAKVSQVP